MNNIIKLVSIASLLFFAACGGSENGDTGVEIEPFNSITTLIDTTYPPIPAEAAEIMDKLQICTLLDTVLTIPPCSADYYRVFQYRTDKKWNAGFIVEMVPGLYGSPVNQVVIIENYFGKYRIVNQYLGALIEMRTTIDGYNDLLIGYSDPDIGLVAIRHEWQGDKYDVVDVEEINNHFVKPELKDSINAYFGIGPKSHQICLRT